MVCNFRGLGYLEYLQAPLRRRLGRRSAINEFRRAPAWGPFPFGRGHGEREAGCGSQTDGDGVTGGRTRRFTPILGQAQTGGLLAGMAVTKID